MAAEDVRLPVPMASCRGPGGRVLRFAFLGKKQKRRKMPPE